MRQDYIFSLLTGYVDPPAGVEIRDGMNYNPFFPGGAISMARVLFDGLVEFDDGQCIQKDTLPFHQPTSRHTCHNIANGQGCHDIPELGC